MKNVLLTIEYDGTDFSGWQKQPNQRTVQGELEAALSFICNKEIKINGTSRTDAGVHAFGQRASFKGEFGIPVEKIKVAVNNYFLKDKGIPGAVGDLRITKVEEVPMDFHARFNAKAKTYIYKIRNAAEPDPFDRNYCYQISRPLNINAMVKACGHIEGTHDFKCFQAQGSNIIDDTTRTIFSLQLYEDVINDEMESNVDFNDKLITMVVTGDGFLYNMVRIIAGTLIDVGIGKISHKQIPEIIKGRNRQNAGHTAPPQGLYLQEVFY